MQTMRPALRKLTLTVHVILSGGWLGAVAAYLALAIVGLTTGEQGSARAVYFSMDVLARFVIVPFCIATLLAGIVESLGTHWGLLTHWWVLVKFLLTTAATLVLVGHLPAVARMSVAAETAVAMPDLHNLRIQLVAHAAGGLLVLLTATALSIYKPWGLTPYGRKFLTRSVVPKEPATYVDVRQGRPLSPVSTRTSRWPVVVGVHAIVFVLLFAVLHLISGGRPSH